MCACDVCNGIVVIYVDMFVHEQKSIFMKSWKVFMEKKLMAISEVVEKHQFDIPR